MKKNKITKTISSLVETACKKKSNYFGYGIWSHHVVHVVTFSKQLAGKLDVDVETMELAALLHDYASIKDYKYYEDHHIHGAVFAEEILRKYHYPQEKIDVIKDAIVNHRGTKPGKRYTSAARILADADAMAHFVSLPSLFFLAFNSHKMDIDEAAIWLKGKLQRSWKKLSPQAKKMVRAKYYAALELF
jgi:uncharacterized protein